MVVSASAGHRVLFQRPQSRGGLAGIGHPGARDGSSGQFIGALHLRNGLFDLGHVPGGKGGDAGHPLRQVQHRAFGGQQRSCGPGDGRDVGSHGDRVAVARVKCDLQVRVHGGETRADDLLAGEHTVLTRGDGRRCGGLRGDHEFRGDVTPRGVLGKARADHGFNGRASQHGLSFHERTPLL